MDTGVIEGGDDHPWSKFVETLDEMLKVRFRKVLAYIKRSSVKLQQVLVHLKPTSLVASLIA